MSVLGCFVLPHPPIILSEVGHGEEKAISETIESFKRIAKTIAQLRPDTIIMSSPHAPYLKQDFFISKTETEVGDLGRFGAPSISTQTKTDLELSEDLNLNFPQFAKSSVVQALDHGVLVPLHFITQEFIDFKFIRIGLSGLNRKDHIALGQQIQASARHLGRRIVFIASGDLSHRLKLDGPYGFHPSGPKFDQWICETLSQGRLDALNKCDQSLCDEAAECGYRSLLIMSGVLKGLQYTSQLNSYEGPYGVGYACASFLPIRDPYVALAKRAIDGIILDHQKITVLETTVKTLLNTQAGVFVSIHKQGQLRGCIGTLSATKTNVALEIIQCAIWAATEDYRFSPIEDSELDQLQLSVDVLGPAEKINSSAQGDVKRYGIIVSNGSRRGLLLPDLEGVDTVSQQISIALQKAGIRMSEAYTLERFEVVRHYD